MMQHGRVPPGWSENPTAWPKRIRLIILAFVGFCIAFYLTLYQLGVFLHLMEPLPDAALGALAYLTEILLSLIGGEDRWRTAPWTVLALGFVIVCGAVVSVVLVVVQPVVAGAWCALCLASAFVSFAIFGLGVKEPLAALRYLRRVRASGASIRRAFWGLDGRQAMFGIRREGKG